MELRELMSTSVDIVDPNATIRDAARKMRADNVGALPVGENDRLIGMVTDRDIAMRGVAEERAPGNTTVREVMSPKIFYCFEDEDPERAASVMEEHQVRRLPILNRDKRLVGIVALADLVRGDGHAAEHALAGISAPSEQPRHM